MRSLLVSKDLPMFNYKTVYSNSKLKLENWVSITHTMISSVAHKPHIGILPTGRQISKSLCPSKTTEKPTLPNPT